jgi:transposase
MPALPDWSGPLKDRTGLYPLAKRQEYACDYSGTIDRIEVITSVQRRHRWSGEEMGSMVQETYAPGMSGSLVVRWHGIAPNRLFRWRRLYTEGALSAVGAGEEVVPTSEYRALHIRVVKEHDSVLGELRAPYREVVLTSIQKAKGARSTPGDDGQM